MIQNRSVIMVLLLMFVTCGIYTLYWIYVTRAELKAETGDPTINPGLELLILILCFPYMYYWIYKSSKDIYTTAASRNIMLTDNSIVNMMLMFLGLGIVSYLIMQNDLNMLSNANINQ